MLALNLLLFKKTWIKFKNIRWVEPFLQFCWIHKKWINHWHSLRYHSNLQVHFLEKKKTFFTYSGVKILLTLINDVICKIIAKGSVWSLNCSTQPLANENESTFSISPEGYPAMITSEDVAFESNLSFFYSCKNHSLFIQYWLFYISNLSIDFKSYNVMTNNAVRDKKYFWIYLWNCKSLGQLLDIEMESNFLKCCKLH